MLIEFNNMNDILECKRSPWGVVFEVYLLTNCMTLIE